MNIPFERMFSVSEIKEIEYVNFGVFSAAEILKISVAKIDNTKFSGVGSVYDERMGINSENSEKKCTTCLLNSKQCPGHFGHIELNEPIIHPGYFKQVLSYLKCFCIKCHTILIDKEQIQILGFSKYKRTARFEKIIEKLKKLETCFHCGTIQPKISYCAQDGNIKAVYKNSDSIEIPLSVQEILKIFDDISDEDVEALGFNPKLIHPRNLIIVNLPVIPPCCRPVVVTDSNISDDDLTIQYTEIIKINQKLSQPEENSDEVKKQKNIQNLKFRISTLFNNSQGKAKHSTNGKILKGIKERMSGKEGQIRNNLMGKRCEQTARTVIGPEPTLRMGQLAVPIEIAANLTVPEVVTQLNKDYLWDLIINGKANFVIKKGTKSRITLKYALYTKATELLYGDEIIRGDSKIIYNSQEKISLKKGDKLKRNGEFIDIIFPQKKNFSIEIGDIVERQLKNGDVVLLNRQPTLHKGSMMAKEIVIMPCKTLRFNLCSTKSFNADFDGDEMNIHVPQTLEARTELLSLSATKHNLITPQTSKPNIVIVQDSLLAAYRMTKPNLCNNLSKSEFFNIANRAINKDGTPLHPKFILDRIQAIRRVLKMKGKKIQAFTGKGLISLILPENFNYENKNEADDTEPIVKIYKGVLYEGVFTKSEIGSSGNSILQILYKEYGKDVSSTFIDNMQFITNQWLVHSGFSVGIKDCIATKTEEINTVIEKCFLEAKGIEETTYHEGIKEVRVNAALSKARDIGLRIAKNALDQKNNFLSTVNSGSKGDFFNIAQITGLLGQQNLCGQRVPKHLNGGKRTLPHYPFGDIPKEMEYESRGFISNSFIHGLNPQQFYFHAMAGREGITDTAMGTSKSGYIQRRIVKVMENISEHYDGTVRNIEGNVFQFAYGDDGFDASESIFKGGVAQACDVGRLIDKLNMEEEK